jgi:hypothetical protein
MRAQLQRKTVYVATFVAILAIAGTYAFAAGTTYVTGPAQNSSTVVTSPNGFTAATVQSFGSGVVDAPIAGSASAGQQESGTNGLGGAAYSTSVLTCGAASCNYDLAAIPTNPGTGLTVGDQDEQVVLIVNDATPTQGFDLQIEVALSTGELMFGNGYFETAPIPASLTAGTVQVFLYLDLGFNPYSSDTTVSNVALVFNACQTATACP